MTSIFKTLLFPATFFLLALIALGQTATPPASQTPAPTGPLLKSNPKITLMDFEAAKAETLASGGEKAELVYAARLDAAQRGSYDCLIVIYAKAARRGLDYFAMVLREGQKLPLVADKNDKLNRALQTGDKYLRMGLRHEPGQAPLLRLMAATTDKEKGEQQRNLDFQFKGTSFELVGQSLMPLPK